MPLQMLFVSAVIAISTCAGFALPFFQGRKQLQRLICIFSLGWMPLLIMVLQVYSGKGLALSDALVLLAAITFPVILFFIGVVIGRPFASIWFERKNSALERTFR